MNVNERVEIERLRERVEELDYEVDNLKAHNDSLLEGRARRKERSMALWREKERFKEAHQQTLRMLALVLLSVPGRRVEVQDNLVEGLAWDEVKLCSERLLFAGQTAFWVEPGSKEERP